MPTLRMMPKVLRLTDAAASRVKALMADKPGVKGLKIGVKKGGCAGMEYTMDYAEAINPPDEVVEQNGARVLIAPRGSLARSIRIENASLPAPLQNEVTRIRSPGLAMSIMAVSPIMRASK